MVCICSTIIDYDKDIYLADVEHLISPRTCTISVAQIRKFTGNSGLYEELRKKLQPMNRPLSNSGRKVIWTNAILKVRLKKFGWYEIENIKW